MRKARLKKVPLSEIRISKINLAQDDFRRIVLTQRRSIFVVKGIRGRHSEMAIKSNLIRKID